ncbi:MAG: DUF4157 domain-containing protein [Pyrinomonadaceae bacterium]
MRGLQTKQGSESNARFNVGGTLQRKCDCGQHTVAGGECEGCSKKNSSLQRAAATCEAENRNSESVPAIVHEVLRSSGQPLDHATRTFFEPRLQHDFSGVRVHTDTKASESAHAVNALAYTVGRDVVFEAGRYAPGTSSGNKLLAHELTHVKQQQGNALQGKLHLDGGRENSFEAEADRVAQTIESSYFSAKAATPVAQTSSTVVQRAVRPGNVTCRTTGLTNPDLSGDEVVAAIEDADTQAIALCQGAETALDDNLTAVRGGDPVDAAFDTILQEELGLTLTNPAHFRLIEQQRNRFRRVRTTLESGYLRYMCRGGTVSLVGCSAGTCGQGGLDFAFSCAGNRLVVLCQDFWDDPAERPGTILHEPFHIWFEMARHNTSALRRADASCFEGFARRLAGDATVSCADHTAG